MKEEYRQENVFVLRMSFGGSVIKKEQLYIDNVPTGKYRYWQDHVEITKQEYLSLEYQNS